MIEEYSDVVFWLKKTGSSRHPSIGMRYYAYKPIKIYVERDNPYTDHMEKFMEALVDWFFATKPDLCDEYQLSKKDVVVLSYKNKY